jgi:UDP-N-acetylmuramoyl-tripeptide--D-alanyl-D-alanine ligase
MPEFPLEFVLEATAGRVVGEGAPAAFRGVSTDTRSLAEGSLFVALTGERFDGHDFVQQALSSGAAGALVTRVPEASGPVIVVEDTLAALGALAKAHRARLSPRVLAITGSTGKTTTKEMLASVLSQGWKTARTPGNFNNEIGLPLALLDLDESHDAVVVELAMRGRGQIEHLAKIAAPQIGVITNIGVSHLEFLGTPEAIAETKAELLTSLPDTGTSVLPAEDEFFDFLKERGPQRVVSFGRTGGADVRAERLDVGPTGAANFLLTGWWGGDEVRLKAPGRHHALNAAATAAAAMAVGAQAEWIRPGLEAFEGAEMRSRIERSPAGYTVIDDCYNAAPDSMRVALELLADVPGKRKWAALGDMKELGPLAEEWHQEVGELAARMGVAGLITIGDFRAALADGARRADSPAKVEEVADNAEATERLREWVSSGDVVLVKGSRAMQMEHIVADLLAPASEAAGGEERAC